MRAVPAHRGRELAWGASPPHIQWLDWNSTIIPGLAIPLVVAPTNGYNIYYVTESATGSGNSNYYYYTFGGGVWN